MFNNEHLNTKFQEVNDDKAHSQEISSDNPSSNMNTNVAICNDSRHLNNDTNAIEGDKLSGDTAMETCLMDTSEGSNTESKMVMEEAEFIPEATAEKDKPTSSISPANDVLEVSTDVKFYDTEKCDTVDFLKNKSDLDMEVAESCPEAAIVSTSPASDVPEVTTDTSDTAMLMEVAESIPEAAAEKDKPTSSFPASDVPEVTNDVTDTCDSTEIVRSKSENITDSIASTTVHPPAEDKSSSVLAPEETSNISEQCQDGNSLAETPNEPEADTSKKLKKKKDKSKKKGDKKSKTDNDDETAEKPKKKKSKTKDISKNDSVTDLKNINEETGKEVKSKVYENEEGEGKMKTADNAGDDDDDEDDWDKMFDDNGDCLEPDLIDELVSHVGQVAIDKPKIDYLAYQPKDADLSSSAYHHLIEIYDFPIEFKTSDLLMSFKSYMNKGFDIKWVDDTHAIGVFSSAVAAQDAVKMIHPLFKVRSIEMASKQSKLKAKRSTEFLMPYKERPKTTAMAARRLVSGALGLTSKISKEKIDQERSQLKEAKEKRKTERKLKQDIWDGSVSKCAMDNS